MQNVIISLSPLLSQIDPKTVWNLITESWDYIKFILNTKKNEGTVKFKTDESTGTVQVENNTGTVNVYNIMAPSIASKISPEFKKMSDTINQDQVTEVSLSDNTRTSNSRTVIVDDASKKLLNDKSQWSTKLK